MHWGFITGHVGTCADNTHSVDGVRGADLSKPNQPKRRLTLANMNELAVCQALVRFIDRLMDKTDCACPLCGHHYIHTDETNLGIGDREYEKEVCPYVLAKMALDDLR